VSGDINRTENAIGSSRINFVAARMLAAAITCVLCATACQSIVSEYRSVKTEIISNPPGAKIEVNGHYIGDAPAKFAFQQNANGDIVGHFAILVIPEDSNQEAESWWLTDHMEVPPKLFFDFRLHAGFVPNNSVPSPPVGAGNPDVAPRSDLSQSPGAGTATTDLRTLLEGCSLVANDGQYLGVITQNKFAEKSILNEFGKYGSKFSSTSIFDEFGDYGSRYSHLSPFDEFTSTPPQIITTSGQFVAYLTKNKVKSPAIDPEVLIALLKSGVSPVSSSDDYVVDSEHWIEAVMDDGNLIKLEDGSIWKVSPVDVTDSALWLQTTSITVIDSDDSDYPYKLVNTDDNEAVDAQLIR
jgi:hypothetical protein